MLLALVIVGGLCLFGVAASLIYLNFASETLRSNGVTAVVVGFAGLLATLWFSLKASDEKEAHFPVVFVLEKARRLPIFLIPPFSLATQYADPAEGTAATMGKAALIKGLTDQTLPAIQPDDISSLQNVYLDVLVSYVMDAMAGTFSKSWDVEIRRSETASVTTTRYRGRNPTRGSLLLQRNDLVKGLPHAEVARGMEGFTTELVVPPGTKAWWDSKEPSKRVLTMSNPFVTVTVTVEWESFMVGGGALGFLIAASIDENQEKYLTLSYGMHLDATFERLLSGNRDMPAYTRWVDTLFGQLRGFDAEERWKRLKKDYTFIRDHQAWWDHQQRGGRATPQLATTPDSSPKPR